MTPPARPPPAALADWRGLTPDEQWEWWNDLWSDATRLERRYRLALRTDWWTDPIQVETLHTLAAWIRLYDTGTWEDPPGKMNLLNELDRARGRLRAGERAFDPPTDLAAFERHLHQLGCEVPAGHSTIDGAAERALTDRDADLLAELERVRARRAELEERARLLEHELAKSATKRDTSNRQTLEREHAEIEHTIAQLRCRGQELSSRIDQG